MCTWSESALSGVPSSQSPTELVATFVGEPMNEDVHPSDLSL
jgi:hypothetical protein